MNIFRPEQVGRAVSSSGRFRELPLQDLVDELVDQSSHRIVEPNGARVYVSGEGGVLLRGPQTETEIARAAALTRTGGVSPALVRVAELLIPQPADEGVLAASGLSRVFILPRKR